MKRAVLALMLTAVFTQFAAAQSAARSTASGVPRTSDGKPDLTGVWQPASNRRGSWEEANGGTGVGGTGRDTAPVPDSQLARPTVREPAPYKPDAAQKVLESYKLRAIDDPTGLCLPPGVPRITSVSLFPMQIIQTPSHIVMLYEYMNVTRVIPLNTKHPDDLEPTYMGDSVGKWEGDTLVVDVTGFNDKTWLIGTGTFHSEALHVTERYKRIDKDTIEYDAVMEDPQVLAKPWGFHSTIMLREGTRVREYICAENNLDPDRYQKMLKEGIEFRRQ